MDALVHNWLHFSEKIRKLNLKDKRSGHTSKLAETDVNKNATRSSLLIFGRDDENLENVRLCVYFANPPVNTGALMHDFKSCGYVCVTHNVRPRICTYAKLKIEKFIKDRLPDSGLYCRMIKVYRLFFMKLSSVLIEFI
ncbi:hypothetical protein RF11_04915 [Thelohanellus kitauei]|uniref:Uncharacterized protein n=1 Tax=Thelohanellus kitauei TaxID=669202 RepID=A0A0C2NLB6_THEKT|nr:hypothetical protein RF11_04915 [Thelohanellus kitauei]